MSIWKNLQFTRFFASYTIGNIGDWFDVFALQIIFVHEWHASPIMMGVLILLYFLPSILLSPIAGVWVDRWSKRNILIYTDALAALLTIGLYLSGSIAEALILLLIRSSIVSINVPAQQAYIKNVVTDEQLLKAVSYTTIVFQMCKVLGPMLGAGVLIITSARMCLAINAVSFIFSTLILMGLPKDKVVITKDGQTENKHWLKDMMTGAKYIWSVHLMRITQTIIVVWLFCSIVRQAQLAIFLKHLLPDKQDALGIFMGFDGLGAVITSSILSRKEVIKHHGLYFCFGFLLLGLGILGVGMYHADWPHYILYLFAIIIGLGTGIQLVNYSYIIKKETPKDQMGRVSGITSAFQNVALTMGTISSGFFVLRFGIREVYLGLSAMMFVLAVCSLIFIASGDKQR